MISVKHKKRATLIWWIAAIVFLCSLPLFLPGMEGRSGQDLGFHLMRIEGIAHELKNGVFPVKMQSLWMEGYGYPVSVYYGDILLYLPAVFRLLGADVLLSYKLFVVFVNLGTAILSFFSFRCMSGDDKRADAIGLICTAAYMSAGYRFLNLYVRSAVGEYCAMMFLPVVAAAVWSIYRKAPEKQSLFKGRMKDSLILAAGLTGLIGTHLLTTEITAFLLLVTGIVFWKKTFSRSVFPVLALAFGETVLLNLYFLIPFLDYYTSVTVYLNKAMAKTQSIQEKGAKLEQLLAFWESPFQQADRSTELLATPGPLLLFALAGVLLLLIAGSVRYLAGHAGKKTVLPGRRTLCCGAVSLVLLTAATRYFLWDLLARAGAVGQMLAQIQFPWRCVGPAVLFLTLMLGSMLCDISRYAEAPGKRRFFAGALVLAMVLCCVGAVIFAVNYKNGYQPVFYSRTEDLNTYDMGMIEYLPYKTQRDELSGEVAVVSGAGEAYLTERKGTTLSVWTKAEETDLTVRFPVLSYPGYHVVDSRGNEYNIRDGKNHEIQVTFPAGFEGTVTLYFQEPWYWHLGEVISLAAATCAIAAGQRKGKRRVLWKRKKQKNL